MRYNIKTTDFELTPAIKEYINKKIAHLDKYVKPGQEESMMCYIEIGKTTNHHKSGDIFRSEFTIHMGGQSVRAESSQEDLYSSLDKVTEEAQRGLTSFKGKKTSLIRRGGAKIKEMLKGFYGK